MKRKILSFALVLVMLAMMFTGCTGKTTAPSTDAPSTDAPSADAPAKSGDSDKPKDITLRFSWWGGDARHKATLENIERYEKKNPHVTIEPEYGAYGGYLDKLYVQLASKTVPDIPAIDGKWVQDMLRDYKDSFVNLKDLPIDLSRYDEEFQKTICGDENFILGASMGTNSYGIIYSVEFFEKFGLSDPNDWDWEDYIEAGKKVQAQDPESHLMYNILNNYGYIFKYRVKQQTGRDIVGDDYSLQFTAEQATEAWDYILRLVESGTVPSFEEAMPYATSYPDQVPKWLEGKYGLHLTQASNLSSQVNGSPFEVKTANLPVVKDYVNIGFPISSSQVLAVYAYGENIDETAKFIEYLVNDEEAIMTTGDTRGIPSNGKARDLLEKAGVLMPQMTEFLSRYSAMGNTAENSATVNSAILELTNEFAQQVGYKKMTPAQAATAYMEELEKVCASLKK